MFKVDWERLQKSSESGLMLRVALAVNDIGSANYLLLHAISNDFKGPDEMSNGLLLYGIRLRCGHLHEVAQLIGKIQNTQSLERFIEDMSSDVQEKYLQLQRIQKGGDDFETYERHISTVRDKLIFHYDKGEICLALGQTIHNNGESYGSVATEEDDTYTRFILADTIMRRELCSVVWGVENTTSEEIDSLLIRTLDLTHAWVHAFHVFGTELCTRYFAGLQPEVRKKA